MELTPDEIAIILRWADHADDLYNVDEAQDGAEDALRDRLRESTEEL